MVIQALAGLLLSIMQQDQAPPVQLELQVVRAQTESPVEDISSIYSGEILWLIINMDLEQQFFEQQLLPQWRSPLDFQAELQTPWLETSTSFRLLETENSATTSMVIDREMSFIQQLENHDDGLIHLQLRQKIQVLGGAIELPSARLKLVWATEFEDDMIRGLIPTNRQTATLTTPVYRHNVLPLPTSGQPSSFSGAVGDYTMRLTESEDTAPRKLQISFRGKGLLNADHLPSLGEIPNFPLRGSRMEVVDDGLLLHLETESEAPLPEIAWSFFDPIKASFVTQTIGAPTWDDVEEDATQVPWMWLGGIAALFAGIFFLPKRSSAPETALPASVEPKDLLDDLALLLVIPRDAIYAEGLHEKLTAINLDPQLAADLSAAVHAIHKARYAGQGQLPSESSLDALRERLQALR